jgi:hypothetical protein
LKQEKGNTFFVIAYHLSDSFQIGDEVFETRYAYYRPGASMGVPLAVIDGHSMVLGGIAGGNMYSYYSPLYNNAAALTPPVDISISLESSKEVRVQVTNTSSSLQTGNLHIALVERFRPYVWKDMQVADFIARHMLTGASGLQMTIHASGSSSAVRQFSIDSSWNYCSIVAFFQAADKQILQGAVLPLEDTIPGIQILTPQTGARLEAGSTQVISWTLSRTLPYVSIQFSTNGGQDWTELQHELSGTATYNWTVPEVNSSQCLIKVEDAYGNASATTGPFTIGAVEIKGDLNNDGVVDGEDRSLLIEHLIENKATQLEGADLNKDGIVDLFDLIYFDTNLAP